MNAINLLKKQEAIHRYVVSMEVAERVKLTKQLSKANREIARLKKRLEKRLCK